MQSLCAGATRTAVCTEAAPAGSRTKRDPQQAELGRAVTATHRSSECGSVLWLQLTTVTDALAHETTYGYDALGNLTSVLNARGKTTTYEYDDLNRLTEETDPLSRSRTYGYDDAGRLTSRTDAKDQTTAYEYDDANRLTVVTYPVGSVTLSYDDAGNVETMVDSTGTTSYDYDDLYRIISATSPGSNTIGYSYDDDGNLETVIYPGSNQVTYSYNEADRLESVTDWLTNTTSYTYDDAGNVQTATFPNDVVATYPYDDAGRLTSVVNTLGEETLSSYTYTPDNVGNRTQMVDLSGTTTYAYDDLYRLTGVTYPNDDEVSYAYDADGNRTCMTVNSTPTSYTYDDADQMTQAGGTSYTYDDNGNLTDRGDDTFDYDYENRLVEATVGETTVSFAYNGAGRRVSKTAGANTTDYLWSNVGSLPVVLYDGNYYVYGRGLIAKTDIQSNQLYYLVDGVGSAIGLADDQGDVVGTYTYDVFGAIRSETGGQANDFKFTQQQLDNDTDLYYLRSRYYDPATGRLLTRDPFAGLTQLPKSLSRYPYALDNPATFADPNGLWPGEGAWNATTGAVGGVVDTGRDIGGDFVDAVTDGSQQVLGDAQQALGNAWPYISYGLQAADLVPLAEIPVVGQVAGEVLDVLAFAAVQIDIIRSGCPWEPLTVANLANLGVGTLGNLTSFVGTTQASVVEATIVGASNGLATGCDDVAYATGTRRCRE
jgi:RHS repeat-associated protein